MLQYSLTCELERFVYILGPASAQTINDPNVDISNHIFANKYHVIASRILRPNTVYKVTM